jgi:hypothetical protein
MFGLLKVLNTVETRKDAPSSPLARTERERLPPNPRLQVARGHGFTPEDLTNDPAIRRELAQEPGQLDLQLKEPTVEWDELRKVKLRELQSYGKDVQRPGEFRIPIERAKQLLLEHSQLAARPQPEQQAPGSAQVTGAITGAEASELVRRSEGYDTLPTYQSSGQKAERRRQ